MVSALVAAWGRPDPIDRTTVIRALGATRSPDALPTLRKALVDPTPSVAIAAVQALATNPAPECRGLLEEVLLLDRPQAIRLRLNEALEAKGLGGLEWAIGVPGYPVARIAQVRREPGQPFATVVATPRCGAISRSLPSSLIL